jgi:hypothetical protein
MNDKEEHVPEPALSAVEGGDTTKFYPAFSASETS